MDLFWTPEAIQDRDNNYDYLELDNPIAALGLDELLSEKAMLLANRPSLGKIGRVSGTRELVVHPNYILIYDVEGELVRILNLVNSARQWPPVHEQGAAFEAHPRKDRQRRESDTC